MQTNTARIDAGLDQEERGERQRHVTVDAYGNVWGSQWRRNFGDEARYPLSSLMGRFMVEGFMATSGGGRRTFAEVFLGQGLEFAAALRHIPEKHREHAWLHYAVDNRECPAKKKAALLGIHTQTYWQRTRAMRSEIAKWLDI